MGSKAKIIILLILAMSVSANAQFRNNKWYFGSGCGIEFDANGNIINTKLPSKIDTEEGSASIDITDKLSLYSDGITVWDNNGNIVLDKLSSNKSCTQAAMFLPRVLNDRISYVDVISLMHHLKSPGASISRIFFDEQGNYSTRPNMTNVQFTKDYLLEEKMAGVLNCQIKDKLFNVLLFKAYKPLTYRDNLFLFAQIGAYRDSFDIKLKENYVGDTTTISHLNSTGYVYNGVSDRSASGYGGYFNFISPDDGLMQNISFINTDSLHFEPNIFNRKLNNVLSKYFLNIYSSYRYSNREYLVFTNTTSKLYILKNYLKAAYYNLDTTIAQSIDSIDIGSIIGESDLKLGAILSPLPKFPYSINYGRHNFYIAANGKDYIIKVDFNLNTFEKVPIGGISRLGLPTRPNFESSCSEIIDYSIFGEAEKKADTVKLNQLKNNSCGGICFNRKFNNKDTKYLNMKFQIAKGDNNKILDGSEPGADGIAIVISKDRIDKCQSGAGALGYSGLRNAIAIELDLFKNLDNNDPNGNHLCIKFPDSSGVLSAIHSNNDIFIKTNGKVMTQNGHYSFYLTMNGVLNALAVQVDSLSNPKQTISPDKFNAPYTNVNIGDVLNKYIGSDEYYITIFGTTGDAIEEHNLYDVYLCKVYDFAKNNPTSIEEEANEANPKLIEKTILTNNEFRNLVLDLRNTYPDLQIFNINGQRLDFDETKASSLMNGTLLFITTENIKKTVYIVNE